MPRKIYKLCVSYDEAGAELRQEVANRVRGVSEYVWQASFRELEAAELPPGDGVLWVYPVFMQSGRTVTETLPEQLRALYAARGLVPELEFKPVWGAERGYDFGVAEALRKELGAGASLLVVAHGVTGKELPPEPSLFLKKLNAMLSGGVDMDLAYFGASPSVEDVLPALKEDKVVVLPFLVGIGKHLREDMPSPEWAAAFGKKLTILPPFGLFYLRAERDYWEARFRDVPEEEFDWPDLERLEDTYAWYLRRFRETQEELERMPEYGRMREGAEAVMDQIHQAFAGVELGGGIGLIQGDYLDTGVSEEVSRGLAARDERHDWTRLADAALNHCAAALSFTDAEGYRFLVPAFMCCELRGRMWNCVFVTCREDSAEWCLTKTALLNQEQRRAMEAYVEFCRSCGEGDGEDWKLPWQWD